MHLHIINYPKSTGVEYVTWAGETFDRQRTHLVALTPDDARAVMEQPQETSLCPDCVAAQKAYFLEQQRREEERKRLVAEQEARTLKAARDYERNLNLIEAHRRGDTATTERILDELVEEDNKALNRAGLTSWDEGSDD